MMSSMAAAVHDSALAVAVDVGGSAAPAAADVSAEDVAAGAPARGVGPAGGVLWTPGGVVARSSGSRAVVGGPVATTRLVTGQRVRVDGTAGTIVVLDDAAPTPTAQPMAAGAGA